MGELAARMSPSLQGIATVVEPTGPWMYIEAFGCEVPMYTEPWSPYVNVQRESCIQYHVPLKFRGRYKNGKEFVSCKECNRSAENWTGLCKQHGGSLHPLDKVTRSELPGAGIFRRGREYVRDLDDLTLAEFIGDKGITKEEHKAAVQELFSRCDTMLQSGLIMSVQTMMEIAQGTAYEPADRIRAATWIFERVRGKVAEQVVVTQDKPFEVVMEAILTGGSREESRRARGIGNAIDAEVVDDGYDDVPDTGDSDIVVVHDTDDPETEVEDEFPEGRRPYTENRVSWPTDLGTAQTTPPTDPDARHTWEEAVAAEKERVRLERVELGKRLADIRNKARNKRYASRSKGLDHVEIYPYETRTRKNPDGSFHIKFVEPKLKNAPAEKRRYDER